MAYRSALRRVVGGAAVPYGYTVVTWTSGGVLIESHGAPDLGGAFLFLAGAAVGFGAVAALGGTGSETHEVSAEIDRRGVGVSSAVAAAAGLGLSAGAAQFVDGAPAFAIVAFLATAAYFLVGAIGVSLLDRRPPTADRRHRSPRRPANHQEEGSCRFPLRSSRRCFATRSSSHGARGLT